MSSSPPHASIFLAPSPSHPPLATFLTDHREDPSHSSRRGPIRVSSPQLFRDILSSVTEAGLPRQAVLPGPSFAVAEESFAGAIQRASRAVANAEEAFHARAEGGNTDNVIDLTRSPPTPPRASGEASGRPSLPVDSGAEADFISTTTHPHDTSRSTRPRLSSSLDHPVYGSFSEASLQPPLFWPDPPPLDLDDSLARARNRRAQNFRTQSRLSETQRPNALSTYHREVSRRDERTAIRRQQLNHENWLRTQARTRRIQEDLSQQNQSLSPEPEFSLSSGVTTRSATMSPKSEPEAIDLTAVEDNEGLNEVIAKQRADAIMSQRPIGATEAGRTTFSAFKCPICMDNLRFATVTKCGHMFCHKCIVDTLKWSATQQREERPHQMRKTHPGHCPVCRSSLVIKDTKGSSRTLVPLHMKKFSLRMKRSLDKGKGRAVDAETDDNRKRKERKIANGRVRRGRTTSTSRRAGTEELFGEFTNDDYATGLVQPS